MFQQFNLVDRLPVLVNVLVGLLHRMPLWRGWLRWFKTEERALAIEALARVGIAECHAQRASTLSGGQQQRAAIARTLVQGAKVVLADEPIASLDPESSRKVMDILSRINREDGSTVVEILAAPEKLIEAVADSPLRFARAAYHLGNRHVPVQILPTDGGGRLRFQTDHVLADMIRGLGCRVAEIEAPFQPESGAYGGGHHHHGDAVDLHDPGHGPHRSVPRIHEFKPR